MAEYRTVKAASLTSVVRGIVKAGGSSDREADLVATNLVEANLKGHDSHGVGMVPRYIDAMKEGGLKINQHVSVVMDGGVLLTLDGNVGYGQVMGYEAMEQGAERAKRNGVCVVGLSNAHHIGRIGHWAEQCIGHGLVSIHFVNVLARPIVAPFGGRDARHGTNPFCVGIPRPGKDPIVLDFATSKIAQGKTRVAYNKGEQLAPNTIIDNHGNPSTDPRFTVIEPSGAILPFGEHKGSGLALICELLGGALTGTGATGPNRRFANGMFAVYVDPKIIDPANFFDGEISRYVTYFKDTRPAAGVDAVLIPGEPEAKMRSDRTKNGVPLPDDTWAAIVNTARDVGVSEASIQRAVE